MFFTVLFSTSLIPGGECHNVHPFVMAWLTTTEETCLTFANAALYFDNVMFDSARVWLTVFLNSLNIWSPSKFGVNLHAEYSNVCFWEFLSLRQLVTVEAKPDLLGVNTRWINSYLFGARVNSSCQRAYASHSSQSISQVLTFPSALVP